MPLAKGVGVGSLKKKRHPLRGSQTGMEWHTVSGQVNLGAKSRNPLISKLDTAEKRKKGESEACPDHSKVVIPPTRSTKLAYGLQNPQSDGLTKNAWLTLVAYNTPEEYFYFLKSNFPERGSPCRQELCKLRTATKYNLIVLCLTVLARYEAK